MSRLTRIVSVVALWGLVCTAATADLVIFEDFDNDPTGAVYDPPTNLNAPGTWLPNQYTTDLVPDWVVGDDSALQMRARNGLGVGASRGGEFTNVGRLGEFNLDGFIQADRSAVGGEIVETTIWMDNGDGEQKFGLSSDIVGMANSTATTWGPAPTSAMVVELVYGQGFSGRFLQAIDHNGRIIALNPVPGPAGIWQFPDGSHMGDYLKFDIAYTVGSGTIAVTLNDTMNLTVQSGFESWGYTEGDPVPLRNLAPQTQVDGLYFAGTRGGTWYSMDDIEMNIIPEPSTLLLAGLGALGLAAHRRRRQ